MKNKLQRKKGHKMCFLVIELHIPFTSAYLVSTAKDIFFPHSIHDRIFKSEFVFWSLKCYFRFTNEKNVWSIMKNPVFIEKYRQVWGGGQIVVICY